MEVTLERQPLGYSSNDGGKNDNTHGIPETNKDNLAQARGTFGFRIVGGTEEGSQVCVGYIVKDGPADRDPRIQTGDEIVNINGVNVVSIKPAFN